MGWAVPILARIQRLLPQKLVWKSGLDVPYQRCGSETQSYQSITSSTDHSGVDSEESGADFIGIDCSYRGCYYQDYLKSRHLILDRHRDYLLMEHCASGHLNPCRPLSVETADQIVQTAPIPEEIPFDQIQCLQLVNLRDELRSPRHIRLLKLYPTIPATLPGTTCDEQACTQLRCEAYQASLDDLTTDSQPLFAAASYVCGDQTPAQSILCGSNTVHIPQNAYDVLSHLRFENRPRLIWIDCVCIKQDDAREKSHQVSMLHTIYAQAHVVSWLGAGHDLDLQGASFYLSLFARLWTDEVRTCTKEEGLNVGINVRRRLGRYLRDNANPHRYSLESIVSILRSDYFTRVWIVQELILGKSNVFQVGERLYPLAVLAVATQIIPYLFTKRPTITNPECVHINVDRIIYILSHLLVPAFKNVWGTHKGLTPHDLYIVTSLNRGICSDPRDHIYGVASLFEESDGYEFDYTLSEAEVFADFAIHCVLRYQDINLLNQARLYKPRNLEPDLPTWCPDWSVAATIDLLFEIDTDTWRASGGQQLVHSRPTRMTLALRGLVVSKVKLCSDPMVNMLPVGSDEDYFMPWFNHNENWCAFFELQGLKIDRGAKDLILDIFKRILPPLDIKRQFCGEVSREFELFLNQLPEDELVDLLAPVYLAAVDPELFKALGLEIDARLPLEDHPHIRYRLRDMITSRGICSQLIVTENNMRGTSYAGVEQGDLVCILYGSGVLQVLRQLDGYDDERYNLIGACIVDGLMCGQGLDMGLMEREFILV